VVVDSRGCLYVLIGTGRGPQKPLRWTGPRLGRNASSSHRLCFYKVLNPSHNLLHLEEGLNEFGRD